MSLSSSSASSRINPDNNSSFLYKLSRLFHSYGFVGSYTPAGWLINDLQITQDFMDCDKNDASFTTAGSFYTDRTK